MPDKDFVGYVYDLVNSKKDVIIIKVYDDLKIDDELKKAKIPYEKCEDGVMVELRFRNRYALHKAMIDCVFRKKVNRVIERIYNEYNPTLEKPQFGKKIWHSTEIEELKKEAIEVLHSRMHIAKDIDLNYLSEVYLDYILSRVYDTTFDKMKAYII